MLLVALCSVIRGQPRAAHARMKWGFQIGYILLIRITILLNIYYYYKLYILPANALLPQSYNCHIIVYIMNYIGCGSSTEVLSDVYRANLIT